MAKSFSNTVVQSIKGFDASYKRLATDSQDLIFKDTSFTADGVWVTIKFNGADSIYDCRQDEMSSVDLCLWSEHRYDESEFSDLLYNVNLSNRYGHFVTFCLNQGTGFIELHYAAPHEVMDLIEFSGVVIGLLYRYANESDIINPNGDVDEVAD